MFLDLLPSFFLALKDEITVFLHNEYLTLVLFVWKPFQNWKFIALDAEEPIQRFIFGTNSVPEVMKMAYILGEMPVYREWTEISITHLLCSTWSNGHLEMWPCGLAWATVSSCRTPAQGMWRIQSLKFEEAFFKKRFELEVIKNNKYLLCFCWHETLTMLRVGGVSGPAAILRSLWSLIPALTHFWGLCFGQCKGLAPVQRWLDGFSLPEQPPNCV